MGAFNRHITLPTLQQQLRCMRLGTARIRGAAGHHAITLESLGLTAKLDVKVLQKLDGFRRKRNRASYDVAGGVSELELEQMLSVAIEVHSKVIAWLHREHSVLLSNASSSD